MLSLQIGKRNVTKKLIISGGNLYYIFTQPIPKGLNYQNFVGIKYDLQDFLENENFEIFFDAKDSGNLDNLIIIELNSNKVKAFQLKHSTKKRDVYKLD